MRVNHPYQERRRMAAIGAGASVKTQWSFLHGTDLRKNNMQPAQQMARRNAMSTG
jgi:hypothetical protein